MQSATKRETTLRERLTYLETGIRTAAALEEAMRLLWLGRNGLGRDNGAGGADGVRFDESLTAVRDDWIGVHRDLASFVAGDTRIRFPAESANRRLRDHARLMFALTRDALPSVVLTLARDLADQWGSTRVVEARPQVDTPHAEEGRDVPEFSARTLCPPGAPIGGSAEARARTVAGDGEADVGEQF